MKAVLRNPLGLSVCLAVPLIATLVSVRTPEWMPASDLAQAEMHVRAVPSHFPLVGAAGRIGSLFEQGSHPGPAGAVALALPYRLFGSSGWSLMAATVVLHLVAIGVALVLTRRIAGTAAMALLAAGLAVMVRSFGTSWFLEPWNPWFGVLPLLVVLLSAWGSWSGETPLLPVFVIAGSFCAQVHVGFAPVVGGLAAALVVRLALIDRHQRQRLGRPLAIGVAVGALIWLPPLIDQVTREPGNLTLLWNHFSDPPDSPAGWRATLSAFVNEVNLFGSWSVAPLDDPSVSPTLVRWLGFLGLIVLVGTALGVAVRRRDQPAVSALMVACISGVLSLLTITRIFGPVSDYLVRWLSTVTLFLVAVSCWSLWRARPRSTVLWYVLGVLAAVALGASMLVSSSSPDPRDSNLLAALSGDVLAATDEDTTYLMRFDDPVSLGGTGFGIMLEMERNGRHVLADDWLRAAVLPQRTVAPEDIEDRIDEVLWVASGAAAIDRVSKLPGARVIASADPRTPREVEQSDALRVSIEDQLTVAGRTDLISRLDEQYGVSQVIAAPGLPSALVAALEEYRALRLPTAVVLAPVGTSL